VPESEGDTTVEGVFEVLEACIKVLCSLIAVLNRQPEVVEQLQTDAWPGKQADENSRTTSRLAKSCRYLR